MVDSGGPTEGAGMKPFAEVFSITTKVVLSLLLLLAVVGCGALVVGFVGALAPPGDAGYNAAWFASEAKNADDLPNRVSASYWKKFIAASISVKCPHTGMTKDEVRKIMLPLTPETSETPYGQEWTFWVNEKGRCTRYHGDVCAEYATNTRHAWFRFSPQGHLERPNVGDDDFNDTCESRDPKGWAEGSYRSEADYLDRLAIQ